MLRDGSMECKSVYVRRRACFIVRYVKNSRSPVKRKKIVNNIICAGKLILLVRNLYFLVNDLKLQNVFPFYRPWPYVVCTFRAARPISRVSAAVASASSQTRSSACRCSIGFSFPCAALHSRSHPELDCPFSAGHCSHT